ncbi:MAG TPA: hypothetical protein VIH59_23150 [Candidatus Tectomicrobia bacterium]|jgi:hypothetical protein
MSRISVQELTPNQEIPTSDAVLEIVSEGASLPVGQHIFQVVVVDSSGNRSVPATAEVIIVDTEAPTAVLDVRPSSRVELGSPFSLSAERSLGIRPEEQVQYIWTWVQRER